MRNSLVLMAFLVLSLGIASASSIPCVVMGGGAGGEVLASTTITCGGLTFSNFEVLNPTGGASGIVDFLTGDYNDPSCPNQVCISFNPNLQSNQDEGFAFTVTGGINEIDLGVGGTNANITELACSSPVPTSGAGAFECPSGTQLGEVTVASGEIGPVTCSEPTLGCSPINPTSPVYIYKNINVGADGGLSEFTQSFDPSSSTPEPVSMVLLGSGLLGLGLLRRRSRKN
ncbi:MAG: PEP-CTERM sorting domain-containing protein [Bryobacteraceae bacterium]